MFGLAMSDVKDGKINHSQDFFLFQGRIYSRYPSAQTNIGQPKPMIPWYPVGQQCQKWLLLYAVGLEKLPEVSLRLREH